MKFTLATFMSASALLVTAAPTKPRQEPQLPDTVYGVDPTQSFYLTAYTAGGPSAYTLQPFFYNFLAGIIGLQAVLINEFSNSTNASSPQANFTLTGDHYGTQLYTYETIPCTSAASCATGLAQWSNNEPVANSPLTFRLGVEEPSFGGLAFYGQYTGGDFEAGETNYLVGADDTDFTKAFTVCNYGPDPSIQLIAYHGTNSSCVPVTVTAVQVGSF